jgi:transcriptional regulator with XRE-family HTH domain
VRNSARTVLAGEVGSPAMSSIGKGKAMRVLRERLEALPHGTQQVLAELAGLNVATLSRWKHGGLPKLPQLEALADAMGVSICYLLCEGSSEQPKLPAVPAASPQARVERLIRRARRTQRELDAARRALATTQKEKR